jgi:hypothetical protein
LKLVVDFLAFEYYHRLKLTANASPYFTTVNNQLDMFLLADHCCVVTQFLFSKAERYAELGNAAELEEENKKLLYEINEEDFPDYISFTVYKAVSLFYVRNYSDCAGILSKLIQGLGLKNYGHIEMEIKLFLAFNYVLLRKPDMVKMLVSSISRKLNPADELRYKNAKELMKILRLLTGSKNTVKETEIKVRRLRDLFYLNNEGENRMLTYLKLDNELISELSNAAQRIKS